MHNLLRQLIKEMAQAQTRYLGIPRKSRLQQLKELVKDPPTHAIRFTNIERANFNPQGGHAEGYGTYVFPLNKYFLKQLMEGQVYFSDYKFIHLFKMPPNVLDLTKNDKRITIKFVKDFLISIKIPPNVAIKMLNDYKEYTLEYSKNEAFYRVLKDHEYSNPMVSNTLRKVGINGFYDPGENIIYEESFGEGSQAIITNPASLEFVETMKTDDVLKSEKIIKGSADSSEEYRNKLLSKTKLPNTKIFDKFTYLIRSDRPGDLTYNNVLRIINYVENNINEIKSEGPITRGSDIHGLAVYGVPKNDKDVTHLLFGILNILKYKIIKTANDINSEESKYARNIFTDQQIDTIFNKLNNISNKLELLPQDNSQNKQYKYTMVSNVLKSDIENLKNFRDQTRNK